MSRFQKLNFINIMAKKWPKMPRRPRNRYIKSVIQSNFLFQQRHYFINGNYIFPQTSFYFVQNNAWISIFFYFLPNIIAITSEIFEQAVCF
jgi:hypothetical protein